MTIAQRIRQARESVGLSQEALARRADVAMMTVSRIERGASQPDLDTLRRLALALGVPLTQLIDP
jgi:transcriptional regulator with XRE-family HTH domain